MEDEKTGFFSKKKVIISLKITVLLLALPLIVFLVQKQQVFKSKAATRPVIFVGSGITESNGQFYASSLTGIKVQLISPIIVPTQTPNVSPAGWHDGSDCSASWGWTCDANDYNANLQVHFYANGPAGSGTLIGATTANIFRQDLVNANVCGGTGNHGFSFTMPPQINDGVAHTIYAHAINTPSGNNPLLLGTPKTITCNTKPVTPTVTVNKSCIATPNDPNTLAISWTNPTGVTAVRAVDISRDNFTTFYNRGVDATTTSVNAPGGFTNYYNGTSWNWGGAQLVLQPNTSYQVRLWNQQYPLTPAKFTTPADCNAPTPTVTPTPTPTPASSKFVLYWGSTPITNRITLEGKYGMAWLNHAGLPEGMTLGSARGKKIIGNDYWPGYSVYRGDPNVVKNADLIPYSKPQELVNRTDRFVLYWGSTPVEQRRAIETQVGSRGYQFSFVNHAGCPSTLQDCINRGLISSSYWPGYSVYQGDTRALQDPGFAPYSKPPELNVQGVSIAYAASYYTTSFKMSKNLADLENAPAQPYDGEPKLVDFTFSNNAPGATETIFVQFIGAGGEKVTNQATITYKPTINIAYRDFISSSAPYWLSQQRSDGTFYDKVLGLGVITPDEHYGHTHIGVSLIWVGVRTNNASLIDAGIRGINYYLNNDFYNKFGGTSPDIVGQGHRPFNELAVVFAYDLLRNSSQLPSDIKIKWEGYLQNAARRTPHPACDSGGWYGTNWQLVEAAAGKEILLTGLTNQSGNKDIFVAAKDCWNNYFENILMNNKFINTLTAKGLGGDPGDFPLTYHAFSTAWVARYLQLSNYQSKVLEDKFLLMTDTQLNLMGPDGDLGYFGRSNEQAFVPSSMVYSFEVAAKIAKKRGDLTKAGQYKAAARRSFNRLQNIHGKSPGGPTDPAGSVAGFLYTTPKLRNTSEFNISGIDGSPPSVYNGLSFLILAMAADTADETISASSIPADQEYSYLDPGDPYSDLSQKPGFVTMRRGNIWLAVARGRIPYRTDDLRYDFGLFRAKKLVNGRWVDILPSRPYGVGFKYTLAPRGFYDAGAFVLQGSDINVSGNAITLSAKLINRTTLSDSGLTTTITYQTDGNSVQIVVPPYNSRVANFYASSLFSRLPDHQIIGSEAVLTDGVRQLSINNTQVLNATTNKDPQKFYDSDLGTVYWDRMEVPNRGQTTIIKLDYTGN